VWRTTVDVLAGGLKYSRVANPRKASTNRSVDLRIGKRGCTGTDMKPTRALCLSSAGSEAGRAASRSPAPGPAAPGTTLSVLAILSVLGAGVAAVSSGSSVMGGLRGVADRG
jgi:hypothetical protein